MLHVIPYTHPGQRPHKGYNRPEVIAGTTVWAIARKGYDTVFHYAYQDEATAQAVLYRICGKLTPEDFATLYAQTYKTLVDFNFTTSPPVVTAHKESRAA